MQGLPLQIFPFLGIVASSAAAAVHRSLPTFTSISPSPVRSPVAPLMHSTSAAAGPSYSSLSRLNAFRFPWTAPQPTIREPEVLPYEPDEEALPFEPPQLPGVPRNLNWAFPSFGAVVGEERDPKGWPKAAKWIALLAPPIGLAWYLWYKWAIEEELRMFMGKGLGGTLVVAPFVAGVVAGIVDYDTFEPAFWGAFAWIYLNQYFLYKKVNELFANRGLTEPLAVWWLLLPGFNFVVGARQVYFLAEYWSIERGVEMPTDDFAEFFPFVREEDLTIAKLLTTPSLWARPIATWLDSRDNK